jgi:hypothetical protein
MRFTGTVAPLRTTSSDFASLSLASGSASVSRFTFFVSISILPGSRHAAFTSLKR